MTESPGCVLLLYFFLFTVLFPKYPPSKLIEHFTFVNYLTLHIKLLLKYLIPLIFHTTRSGASSFYFNYKSYNTFKFLNFLKFC